MSIRGRSFISPRGSPVARHGLAPLGSEFVVILAVLFSVLFILSASLAFVNPQVGPVFKDTLNAISAQQAGIVLLGENVDVDVDEPSVTVRWTVLGCGTGFILPGSPKLHQSSECGVPAIPLEVFVDNSEASIFAYDPADVPVTLKTNQHVVVQALVQFDHDLVLDVHDSRLYPYDTYLVSTSLRATSSNSTMKDISVPIIGMPAVEFMPSFTVSAHDTDVAISVDGDTTDGRVLELRIRRPGHARVYAMLIFGINWTLCHFNLGIALLSALQGSRLTAMGILSRLAGTAIVLLVIPQLRGTMPDSPGFDGVLIDTIGYFPQMTLAGLSVVVLLLITAKCELENISEQGRHHEAKSELYQSLGSRPDGFASTSREAQVGHNRNSGLRDRMSTRDHNPGSRIIRNSSFGGSVNHLRSRSYHERKMA